MWEDFTLAVRIPTGTEKQMLKKADLYDQDLYAWTQEQVALLQAGGFDRLDISHLVEELQLMGGSERGELANRLIVLLTHLLKLHVAAQHLPTDLQRAGAGWHRTCRTQRLHIAKVLRRNPSLRRTVPEELADAYEIARVEAAGAPAIAEAAVPTRCPWGWSSSWMPTSGRRRRRHNERCGRAVVRRVGHRRNRSV